MYIYYSLVLYNRNKDIKLGVFTYEIFNKWGFF